MEGTYVVVPVLAVLVEGPAWMPRGLALTMYAAACIGLVFVVSAASSANLLVAANAWVQGPGALPDADVQRRSRVARMCAFVEILVALVFVFLAYVVLSFTAAPKDDDNWGVVFVWLAYTSICSLFASFANICWANYSLSKLREVSAPSAEESQRLRQLRAEQLAAPAGEASGLLEKQFAASG